jgi:catechol 2,3-dioxygenase-like lactoylglutathione lyase family enzyme
MPTPNLVLLYVKDTQASVAFYRDLLGREPVAAFPTYAAFALGNGLMLGLWSTSTVAPPPSESGNRTELAFMVEGTSEVEALYAGWRARGLPMAQELTTMVFGPTFVILDPDGHRLRVCLTDK